VSSCQLRQRVKLDLAIFLCNDINSSANLLATLSNSGELVLDGHFPPKNRFFRIIGQYPWRAKIGSGLD
jgi:hypothetical protein